MDLDIVYEVACGLDIHFAEIAACLIRSGPKGRSRIEERRYATTRKGLDELRGWLAETHCQAVGMEATGVYWMPVYAALEDRLHVVVGNPQHMRNLRGHKTDRKDARWIAGMVRHGLIRPSFVPPPVFREARELARFRRQLVNARSSVRNEVLRLLACHGITLADVLSNVFGVSGAAILQALAEGQTVIEKLSRLIHPSVQKKLGALTAALESPLARIPRELLTIQLQRLDDLDRDIEKVERLLAAQMEPFDTQLKSMMKVPGISWTSACIILAEIGVDMSAWPTEKHLAAWAGVAPGSRESGGRRMSSHVRKGNEHLTTILVECAGAAVRKKDCHLGNKFHRLRARVGYKKALMAIARKLLLIIRQLLVSGEGYREPAPSQASEKAKQRAVLKRVKDLHLLGYDVTLIPAYV